MLIETRQEAVIPEVLRPAAAVAVSFLQCEVTGFCQLRCRHCYAGSGPGGTHGWMSEAGWLKVIGQASALGVRTMQFIGGEPTLYAPLASLIGKALALGIEVEVFTNLVHVPPALWDVFSRPGVRLATSWYSDDPDEHAAITGRPGHARTKANIAEAVRRGIPLRAGIISVLDRQRAAQARVELETAGVTSVTGGRVRGIGRAARTAPDAGELCGHCGKGMAAITPDGDVLPCVMSRWLRAGNVRRNGLAGILAGPQWRAAVSAIPAAKANPCSPDKAGCKPKSGDGADCHPAEKPACKPKY